MDLWSAWKRQMEDQYPLHPGERVLVAVSGGPDSMVLFHLLHRYASLKNLQLFVGHVHHGFRPEESDREQQLVVDYAIELDWPVFVSHLDLPHTISHTRENAQAAARRRRYDFLLRLASESSCAKIALAHHADDQAETVLSRLLKGSGTAGLSGMLGIREEQGRQIFRPLLSFSKEAIVKYAEINRIPYAVDSSNDQTKYDRNRIRLEILPMLESHFPGASQALCRMSAIMRDEHDYLDQIVGNYMKEHAECTPDQVGFTRNSFLDLHPALQRRLFLLVLSYLSPDKIIYDYNKIEHARLAVSRAEPPTFELSLGNRVRIVREYDQIKVTTRIQPVMNDSFYHDLWQLPAKLQLPGSGLTLYLEVQRDMQDRRIRTSHDDMEAYFDFDQISFPLTIRSRMAGDRMQVKGLNGSKKVKDMFIDKKIPPSQRDQLPLITDGDNRVLWIPGIGISQWASPHQQSGRILHIICRYDID